MIEIMQVKTCNVSGLTHLGPAEEAVDDSSAICVNGSRQLV
jgi:hypothetical protein